MTSDTGGKYLEPCRKGGTVDRKMGGSWEGGKERRKEERMCSGKGKGSPEVRSSSGGVKEVGGVRSD